MRIKGRNKKEPRLAICRGFRRRGSAPRSVKRNTAALEDSSGGLPGSVRFRTSRQTARRFFAAACCRPKCRGPRAASKEKSPGRGQSPGASTADSLVRGSRGAKREDVSSRIRGHYMPGCFPFRFAREHADGVRPLEASRHRNTSALRETSAIRLHTWEPMGRTCLCPLGTQWGGP